MVTQPDSAASNKWLAIFNMTVSIEWNWRYADLKRADGRQDVRNRPSQEQYLQNLAYSIKIRGWFVAGRIGRVKTDFLDNWGHLSSPDNADYEGLCAADVCYVADDSSQLLLDSLQLVE